MNNKHTVWLVGGMDAAVTNKRKSLHSKLKGIHSAWMLNVFLIIGIVALSLAMTACGNGTTTCTHAWGSLIPATCEEDGVSTGICELCGEVNPNAQTLPALGHDMKDTTVETPETCLVDGEMNTACDREGCGHTGTRPIEALGGDHDWDWDETTPTTDTANPGEFTKTCLKCGETDTMPVTAGLLYEFVAGTGEQEYMVSIGTATDAAIILPATYNNLPVTEIKSQGFSGNTTITSVFIPASVKAIGTSAFNNCPNLASVTIPSSVRRIGQHAFLGTTIWNDAPDGIVYISNFVVGEKGDISGDITIAAGTIGIADSAFANSSITSITIPASVTFIDVGAFEFSAIETVIIGEGSQLETIGQGAFEYCSSLTAIVIPASVKTIGYAAFDNSSLNNVFFGGADIQAWNAIDIDDPLETNFRLTTARRYYYSASGGEGTHWRWVDGVPTPW
jgi:hypothetical protein